MEEIRARLFFTELTDHWDHAMRYLYSNYYSLGTYNITIGPPGWMIHSYLIEASMKLTKLLRGTKRNVCPVQALDLCHSRPVFITSFPTTQMRSCVHSPDLACGIYFIWFPGRACWSAQQPRAWGVSTAPFHSFVPQLVGSHLSRLTPGLDCSSR